MPNEQVPKDPLDLDSVDRDIRINELSELVKDRGGEMHVNDDCPPEAQEQFLRNIIDIDAAPVSTRFDQLQKRGMELPAPDSLDDAALHAKLWEVIKALAAVDAYVYHTNHLSERQLYEHLWNDSLREETAIMPPGSGWTCHIDILGGCSEEDIEIGLRYYDSEEQRQHWAKEFPKDEIPPHEEPPYDRDRLLPQAPPPPMWIPDEDDEGEFSDDTADGEVDK